MNVHKTSTLVTQSTLKRTYQMDVLFNSHTNVVSTKPPKKPYVLLIKKLVQLNKNVLQKIQFIVLTKHVLIMSINVQVEVYVKKVNKFFVLTWHVLINGEIAQHLMGVLWIIHFYVRIMPVNQFLQVISEKMMVAQQLLFVLYTNLIYVLMVLVLVIETSVMYLLHVQKTNLTDVKITLVL